MRLKSNIWVAAYIRRCNVEGAFAAVRRHGSDEAGAIFIKVSHLNGLGTLYAPAPQTLFDESRPSDRLFSAILGAPQPISESDIEKRLEREIRFDPDMWIIEVEERTGRNFLDDMLTS
jgi:hypothetical protein